MTRETETMIMIAGWKYPEWKQVADDQWLLEQDQTVVGEAYARENGGFKWHCKLSDTRDTEALSIEQAKAECLASFWQEQWRRLAEKL